MEFKVSVNHSKTEMKALLKVGAISDVMSIPYGWTLVKLKHISIGSYKGSGITKEDLSENGEYECVRYADIYTKYDYFFKLCKNRTDISNLISLRTFTHGAILFSCTGELVEEIGKSIVYLGNKICLAGGDVFVVKHNQDPLFMAFALESSYVRAQKSLGKSKLKVVHMYPEEILNLVVLLPPIKNQKKIGRYLSWKSSEINRLINGYQKQISLLREYRQTLIDNAVTHGIEKAHLKQSGVSWIKEIPEHWNMVYAKKLFAQRKEKAYLEDEQLTASQKYGVISQNKFMELEGRRLTVVITGEDILKHVGKGDFVLSMRSFQGGLEYSEEEGKISSAYVMLIPNTDKVYAPFFKWLLKSKHYIKALQGTSDLVRDGQALRYANFAKVPLPEIPISEQIQIANYINSKTQVIDNLISKTKHKIELIKEYKATLISNVVIGQVDVRDVQIPEYATVELNDVLDDSDGKIEG